MHRKILWYFNDSKIDKSEPVTHTPQIICMSNDEK